MYLIIALIAIVDIVFGHPPLHAPMHETVSNLINNFDSKLTSKPMLRVTKPLQETGVDAGEYVALHCEVVSTPVAVIYWEKDGKRVQGDEELNVKEKMMNRRSPVVESGIVASTFSIPCAQPQDSGKYRCIASNGHSTVKSSSELIVGGQANCKSTYKTPPTITQWTESRFEMEGNTATLLCRTNVLADRTWTFDGQEININEGRYAVLPNGDLRIKNIAWPDMGTYTCVASNNNGEASVDTFLYPSSKKTF